MSESSYYSSRDGLVSLAVAIINQAQEDYNSCIENGDYIGARIVAEQDTRGLVGYILEWTTDDREFLFKRVLKKTDKFLVD